MAPGAPRRVTWRRLPQWPWPDQQKRKDGFQATNGEILDQLETEVRRVGGTDLAIGVVTTEDQVYLDGTLRSGFKVIHPGAEVSFQHPERGLLTFHTAAYGRLYANLRAIGLSLEALRAVDRYGVADTAEQYAGWAQLPAGEVPFTPDPEEGQRIAAEHGGLRAAIKALHPDRNEGQTLPAYQHVMAFKEAIGA